MKTYRGGETVEPGLYFNERGLAFKSVDERGALPGARDETYRKVPTVALLVVGPVLGLAYAVFLPFLGVAMATSLIGVKAAHLAGSTAREAVRVLRPGWEPALSFLSRPKPAKGAETADTWSAETRKKVEPGDEA